MPEQVDRSSVYLNEKSKTRTQTRVRDMSLASGICAICIRECPFLCEISLLAFRGREALHSGPLHYVLSTAACMPLGFKGIEKLPETQFTRSHENLTFAT